MKKILETERLILRQFEDTDAPFIIELLNTGGWLKYIGDRNVKTHEDAIKYLDNGPLKSYKSNGFGLYIVLLKDSSAPIGMCGFVKRAELDDVDIGFAFLPEYSGQGYAFEIAKPTLQYGFDKFKFERVVGITAPGNKNSIRLLEKLGLQNEKEIEKDNKTLLLFGINKTTRWSERHKAV